MTLGSLSIRREAAPWSKSVATGYLTTAAVGVLAGVVVAYARIPLHLPGHKALFWIPPILAARLLTRLRFGALVGALATAVTTLSLGGRLSGGGAGMSLVILAGIVLDAAASLTRPLRSTGWELFILFASAGALANLVCGAWRLFEPHGQFRSTGNIEELRLVALSHATFGLAAGALAMLRHLALETPARRGTTIDEGSPPAQ